MIYDFILDWQESIFTGVSQCPKTDLNKKFKPRPKTNTAQHESLCPRGLKLAKVGSHSIFQKQFFTATKIALQWAHEYIQTQFTSY